MPGREWSAKEMLYVADCEYSDPEKIRNSIAKGTLIIPANINHRNLKPIGIGSAVTTKINANIGGIPSPFIKGRRTGKIRLCMKYGADTAMDLSTGGDLDEIRTAIIEEATIPIGTVPMYQVVEDKQTIDDLTPEDWLRVIEKQANHAAFVLITLSAVMPPCL